MAGLIRDVGLATRNLSRNRSRSAVAILAVASGVCVFLLAGGFIAWIFQDMREGTIHSQLGHAQIVRPAFFDKGIANPYDFLLPADSAEQRALGALPGVTALTPRLVFAGLLSLGDTTISFSGEGIDPGLERPISKRIRILEGNDLASSDERKVLLGEGLARNLGARPGDTVVLLTSGKGGRTSAIEASVAGIFATISKEYDDVAVRAPLSIARKLMRVEGATSWVVLLDSAARTHEFVDAARRAIPSSSFEVVPWTALADFYNKTVALFSRQVSVVKFIIGLIVVLTITNTMTMSVLERTTEIGTGLALGVRRIIVMRLFVVESLMIGIVGGIVGIGLGYLLAALISAIGIPMPPPPGMAHGYIGQIVITADLVSDAVALSIVTTLLAGLYPAWKAGRMNIVDALRYSQ